MHTHTHVVVDGNTNAYTSIHTNICTHTRVVNENEYAYQSIHAYLYTNIRVVNAYKLYK